MKIKVVCSAAVKSGINDGFIPGVKIFGKLKDAFYFKDYLENSAESFGFEASVIFETKHRYIEVRKERFASVKEYRVHWAKDSECVGYKYFDDFMSAFYFAVWCYCGGDSAVIERYDYKTRSYTIPHIEESPDYIIIGEKISKKEINPIRVDI